MTAEGFFLLSEHAAAGLTGNAAACGVEDRKAGRKIRAAASAGGWDGADGDRFYSENNEINSEN